MNNIEYVKPARAFDFIDDLYRNKRYVWLVIRPDGSTYKAYMSPQWVSWCLYCDPSYNYQLIKSQPTS